MILAEASDNIGAGAPGNGTALLGAFLRRRVEGAGTTINDPDAVALRKAGSPRLLDAAS